jgi:hypothetical protein
MHTLRHTSLPLIVLSIVLTGCLPSSCNRVESRVITPADSTSRVLAASLPVDTLAQVFSREYEREDFVNPRTLLFDAVGNLIVADSRTHTVHLVDREGEIAATTLLPGTIPYLAGQAGDTTWVFSPIQHHVHRLVGMEHVDSLEVDLGAGDERALNWLVKTETGFISKVLDDASGNHVAFLNESGSVETRMDLPGPTWRYAGLLRERGGAAVSLSGFLPFVYDITKSGLDSTRLVGFDSPMLARTLQFELGATEQPPLLSGSAALAGDWLFVLNMRPGWLHVDVYDADGMLAYVLTQPDPAFNKEYYPTDIAVRQIGERDFELAVTIIEPSPGLERYTWTMPERHQD